MRLTLITVNFNGAEATIELLRSLEKQSSKDFDVLVVDNDSASADRTLLGEYASTSPLKLDVIYGETNRGFSGGNNLAIKKALAQKSEWILLINNDTAVQPDFIERLTVQLPHEPSVVSVPLNDGQGIVYGGITQWLLLTLKHDYGLSSNVYTGYAIGAGLLVHRDVFEKIGLLDEKYFLYFEDADFSMRARRADIPIQFLHEPIISHRESESTKKLGSPLLLRYHTRNALLFNMTRGPWWVRIAVPFWAIYTVAKQGIKIIIGRARPQSRAILAGVFDFVFRRWGKIDTRPVIAIECESIEHDQYGVARMTRKLLEQLAADSEQANRYRYVLYFNKEIPDELFLKNPKFEKRIVGLSRWGLPSSFSLYYYAILPLWLWFTRPALTYWPNYMLPLIAPRPSLVMLTEDIAREMRNPHLPVRYRIAYRIFGTWAARTATRIMAISHTSKQNLANVFHVQPERIMVNELATDPTLASPKMEGDYVLFVGQAFPRRHVRETIKAFEKIADQHRDTRLIAVGPDRYQPPVIDALVSVINARLGRPAIQHINAVSDAELARFYAGAQACVYVSKIEAFGLPPLEALGHGVPPVLADTPLNREIYRDHAFYVHPAAGGTSTVEGIAEALHRSLTDTEHRQHIKSAAPEILARYTWAKHTQRWLGILQAML